MQCIIHQVRAQLNRVFHYQEVQPGLFVFALTYDVDPLDDTIEIISSSWPRRHYEGLCTPKALSAFLKTGDLALIRGIPSVVAVRKEHVAFLGENRFIQELDKFKIRETIVRAQAPWQWWLEDSGLYLLREISYGSYSLEWVSSQE